jgi:hypothetical protein
MGLVSAPPGARGGGTPVTAQASPRRTAAVRRGPRHGARGCQGHRPGWAPHGGAGRWPARARRDAVGAAARRVRARVTRGASPRASPPSWSLSPRRTSIKFIAIYGILCLP